MIYQAGDIIGTNQLIEKDLEKICTSKTLLEM